ncbi:MAG: ATP-binding protein [Clostridia bacterium]|nr:ATP-binding protein [Clostridia bacterium]
MEYIQRHVEAFAAVTFQTFKCLLVTGARQTGKSTLLAHLFPNLSTVTLDDEFIREQAQNNPSSFVQMNPPPVFYDEVQYAPSLFPQIKIRSDLAQSNGLFCLSGSQPLHLMKNVSESLSGRVGILNLMGLSLREMRGIDYVRPFLPTMDYITDRRPSASAPEDIWRIIHRGSYPGVQDSSVNWNTFYSSYVSTYLERDVRSLSSVQNLSDFRRFMVATAARTGQMLNYSNIADEVGRDEKTIRNWMSILEASGIVIILEPYAFSALKRAIKTPKVYFCDTGLAAWLTRWLTPEALANGAMSGAFFETFVINEIIKSYTNCGRDYRFSFSYYRGKDRTRTTRSGEQKAIESEIDLIIEENGILYPIEIKKSDRVAADEASAFQVLDRIGTKKRGTGAIICTCSQPAQLRENVFALPYWFI